MGYCKGVSQVIELAQDVVDRAKREGVKAYSIGWFIHNPSIVNYFKAEGMENIDAPEGHEAGIALIRAHGITDELRERFISAGFTLIDGTCPTVIHSQNLVRNISPDDHALIIGLHRHSEVIALGRVHDAAGNYIPVQVVETEEEVDTLSFGDEGKIVTVVQTTFEHELFSVIRDRLEEKFPGRIEMANRLCPSTKRRHDSLISMLDEVDAVLVVGGSMSANTKALAELVASHDMPVWHIETADQIPEEIYSYGAVGITAGTSTPEKDIAEVIETLHREASDEG